MSGRPDEPDLGDSCPRCGAEPIPGHLTSHGMISFVREDQTSLLRRLLPSQLFQMPSVRALACPRCRLCWFEGY